MLITIQKVWPNDQGKPNGKFVGTDGKNYYIEARHHGRLYEGLTIDPPSVKPSEYNGKTNYFLPKGWSPPLPGSGAEALPPAPNGGTFQRIAAETVGKIIPAPPRPAPPPYVAKDDELITRLAILKSLIESGEMLSGNKSMDDLVALAWETAPKLKVWK